MINEINWWVITQFSELFLQLLALFQCCNPPWSPIVNITLVVSISCNIITPITPGSVSQEGVSLTTSSLPSLRESVEP